MKVFFVGAGPGDPELLTLKAARLLRTCLCCVYAGSLVNPAVIELLPPDAAKWDSATMNLEETTAVCREARDRQIDVVRLHSGDPSIYGAINEQMRELDKLGIEYEVIPGVSSFQASAAALKTELTSPEVSQTIILTRTSGRTPLPETQELRKLAASRATFCLFLSIHNIANVIADVVEFYGTDCPVAVVYRASWPDQKILRGTLDDIAEKVATEKIHRTAMIVIGRALGESEVVSRLYAKEFSHGYRS